MNVLQSIGVFLASIAVSILAPAAEAALKAQAKFGPAQTPAQRAVDQARDGLLEGITQLATALEHLEAEHLESQAALNMHSNQAAQAFMRIQGLQGFAAMVAESKEQVERILNPQPPQTQAESPVTTTETAPTETAGA